MNKKYFLLGAAFKVALSNAQSPATHDRSAVTPTPSTEEAAACEAGSSTGVSCERIIDQLCSQVVSPSNNSLLNVPLTGGERLNLGVEPNLIETSGKIDDLAFADAVNRLPLPLRPWATRMARLWAKPASSLAWFNEYSSIQDGILKTERDGHITREEVERLKYENHPNWLRARRAFAVAKADLIAQIKAMPFPEEYKEWALRTLPLVQLRLVPTEADRSMPAGMVDESNAFYGSGESAVAVETSFINKKAAVAPLYSTFLHELGHSIEPQLYARAQFFKGPAADPLRSVLDLKSLASLGCGDWAKTRTALQKSASPSPKSDYPPAIEKLVRCLTGADERTPSPRATAVARKAAARSDADEGLADSPMLALKVTGALPGADWGALTDILDESDSKPPHGRAADPRDTSTIARAYLAKTLSCAADRFKNQNELQKMMTYDGVKREAKAELTNLFTATESWGSVDSAGVAAQLKLLPSSETFADWAAVSSAWRYLKRLPAERRAQAYAAFSVSFCGHSAFAGEDEKSPGQIMHDANLDPGFQNLVKGIDPKVRETVVTWAENTFDDYRGPDAHPWSNDRQRAFMTPALGEAAGCCVPKDLPSYGRCGL